MTDSTKPQEQLDGEKMLAMMQHAVGLDQVTSKRKAGYRNYYAASEEAAKGWLVLVGLGLATQGNQEAGGKLFYFHVSQAGLRLLGVKVKR